MHKYIGDRAFYGRVLKVMIPIVIQQGITHFVGLLDNIVVGQVGTEQMSGVAITNQLLFIFQLCIFGCLSLTWKKTTILHKISLDLRKYLR